MTNRVHIDAPAGIIDIEGEKGFVEGLLAKLFPLIEEAGFGSRPLGQSQSLEVDDESSVNGEAVVAEDSKGGKVKVKRKRNVAPKGHSCADRVLSLKDGGFFKAKRGAGEIVAGLTEKGYTHNSNQVTASAESLFKRGMLQRTKDGGGPWLYFWDRD